MGRVRFADKWPWSVSCLLAEVNHTRRRLGQLVVVGGAEVEPALKLKSSAYCNETLWTFITRHGQHEALDVFVIQQIQHRQPDHQLKRVLPGIIRGSIAHAPIAASDVPSNECRRLISRDHHRNRDGPLGLKAHRLPNETSDACRVCVEKPMAQAKNRSSSSKSTTKKAAAAPDAVDLLTADHAEVKEMFEAYEELVIAEADDDERQALATQICEALTVHATVEEELFYPAAREALDEQEVLDEAEVEHAGAKDLMAQIQSMMPSEALYNAKVKVLGEYIEHHVQEEEGEMFPKVRKAEIDLEALGQEMLARKQELTANAESDG